MAPKLRTVLETSLVIIAVIVAAAWIVRLQSRGQMRELDKEELIVRDAIREVYGERLVSDEVGLDPNGDMILTIRVVEGLPFASAKMNISSLARKHRDGLTLVNIKAAVSPDGVRTNRN